jgi:hypothetical protein
MTGATTIYHDKQPVSWTVYLCPELDIWLQARVEYLVWAALRVSSCWRAEQQTVSSSVSTWWSSLTQILQKGVHIFFCRRCFRMRVWACIGSRSRKSKVTKKQEELRNLMFSRTWRSLRKGGRGGGVIKLFLELRNLDGVFGNTLHCKLYRNYCLTFIIWSSKTWIWIRILISTCTVSAKTLIPCGCYGFFYPKSCSKVLGAYRTFFKVCCMFDRPHQETDISTR